MASITFRMNQYKDLIAVSNTKVYQKEKNVDNIAVLLPRTYNDVDLADFKVMLKYIDFANAIHSEEMEKDEEIYEDVYYRYVFPITEEFTQIAGEVSFTLSVEKGEEQVLHTNSAAIEILPWKDYAPFKKE